MNFLPWGALTAAAAMFSLSMAASRPALKLAERYGLIDRPGQHKRHRRDVPIVGGIVLFPCLWLTVGAAALMAPGSFAELSGRLLYVFSGATIVFLIGLSDDLVPLEAWTKLAGQIAAGLVVYLGGLKIDPVSIPFAGSVGLGDWSVLITVLWVVGLTNAINIIDGLDGLATGVSLVGAVTMAAIGFLYGVETVVLLACALAGFLMFFLTLNRYPARAFLGDSGALQIGYCFAVISLLVPLKSFTAAALYLPLLALGVPLMEVAISVFRRLAARRNIMQADRRHLFHYLALAGLSPRQVVYIFWALSVVFGLFALAMYFWDRLIVFGLLVLFMVVISVLFLIFMANLGRNGGRGRHESGRNTEG